VALEEVREPRSGTDVKRSLEEISMTSRYVVHVLPPVMTDAAGRIGRALLAET